VSDMITERGRMPRSSKRDSVYSTLSYRSRTNSVISSNSKGNGEALRGQMTRPSEPTGRPVPVRQLRRMASLAAPSPSSARRASQSFTSPILSTLLPASLFSTPTVHSGAPPPPPPPPPPKPGSGSNLAAAILASKVKKKLDGSGWEEIKVDAPDPNATTRGLVSVKSISQTKVDAPLMRELKRTLSTRVTLNDDILEKLERKTSFNQHSHVNSFGDLTTPVSRGLAERSPSQRSPMDGSFGIERNSSTFLPSLAPADQSEDVLVISASADTLFPSSSSSSLPLNSGTPTGSQHDDLSPAPADVVARARLKAGQLPIMPDLEKLSSSPGSTTITNAADVSNINIFDTAEESHDGVFFERINRLSIIEENKDFMETTGTLGSSNKSAHDSVLLDNGAPIEISLANVNENPLYEKIESKVPDEKAKKKSWFSKIFKTSRRSKN